jgi:hypothetical protein
LVLGGRSQPSFSGTHIGPALQQLARVADGQSFFNRWIGTRCEIRIEFARAASGEHRQSVFRTRNIKVQRWNRGLNGCYAGSGTRNILFFTHAGIAAQLREPQRFALVRKTALGHCEAPLRAPKLEVIASKLSDHADLHIVKVRLERLVLGPSCRDSMANSSEQVRFPESIEPGAKGIDSASLVPEAGNLFLAVLVGGCDGHRRKTIQLSFIEDSARFAEPGTCDSNAVV